jgi:hypothetical protein
MKFVSVRIAELAALTATRAAGWPSRHLSQNLMLSNTKAETPIEAFPRSGDVVASIPPQLKQSFALLITRFKARHIRSALRGVFCFAARHPLAPHLKTAAL